MSSLAVGLVGPTPALPSASTLTAGLLGFGLTSLLMFVRPEPSPEKALALIVPEVVIVRLLVRSLPVMVPSRIFAEVTAPLAMPALVTAPLVTASALAALSA